MAFVRTVKTASGATAVQIVYSHRGGSREIEHIGSAHDEQQLEALKAAAVQRLAQGQGELDLGLAAGAASGPLPIVATRAEHLWEALSRAYDLLGFGRADGGDVVFRQLVLARILEPTSELDSLRVLSEVGIEPTSYRTSIAFGPAAALPVVAPYRHAGTGGSPYERVDWLGVWSSGMQTPSMTEAMTPEQARELYQLLDRSGVHCWVMGGWGVDALLERVTREHKDLDLLVLLADLPRYADVVQQHGFERQLEWGENQPIEVDGVQFDSAFVDTHPDGREIDVHVIDVDQQGVASQFHLDPWQLPTEALTGSGTIDGAKVRCVTPGAQITMHSGYDLPETHREDVRLLRSEEFMTPS